MKKAATGDQFHQEELACRLKIGAAGLGALLVLYSVVMFILYSDAAAKIVWQLGFFR